ncbi:cupin domain-containing protein [Wenyingzhuangia sp. IMCC45574]
MVLFKRALPIFSIVIFFSCQPKKHEHSHSTIANTPAYVSSEKGKVWNVFGVKIIGKILSEDTNGAYSVIVTETPAGGGPPKHIHQHEDELFYVLKGNYIFYCGIDSIAATEGDFIRLPKGIPHHFKNRDSITGITMNTITPGGFENFFNKVAIMTQNKTLTRTKVDSLAHKFGIQFLK